MKNYAYLILTLILLFTGCMKEGPETIKPSAVSCEFCAMHIADMRFHTQFQSDKGRRFHFDSIECALDWHVKNQDQKFFKWTTGYNDGGHINMEEAWYLVSSQRQSPMKAGFSAYASREEALQAKETAGGSVVDFNELASSRLKK